MISSISTYILMIFGIKEKSIILTNTCIFGYCYNILQRLKTGFVVQGHICTLNLLIFRQRRGRECDIELIKQFNKQEVNNE